MVSTSNIILGTAESVWILEARLVDTIRCAI
jgi:hypothetical protein